MMNLNALKIDPEFQGKIPPLTTTGILLNQGSGLFPYRIFILMTRRY